MRCTHAEFCLVCARNWERSVIQQPRRLVVWMLLLALLTYMSYLSFRAYLSPEFLIGFANLFSC
jgi:hypothetical protein